MGIYINVDNVDKWLEEHGERIDDENPNEHTFNALRNVGRFPVFLYQRPWGYAAAVGYEDKEILRLLVGTGIVGIYLVHFKHLHAVTHLLEQLLDRP